ncbi:MAG TPA: peptide chain release factor N(5)-glutamine methyltransferase, partial [Planctomycetota bacterium]|nr:peptide chain release factor N(5)-glutamine methyltransferase [Planctomycetota bacterium]
MNLLEEARKYLASCGILRPDDDVKLLAAFAARRPLRDALGAPPPPFTADQEKKFRRLVARRGEKREPTAYIVGTEAFLELELAVTPSVLIPRPSTETLVEIARRSPPGRFLDVGTGSGAIAVALAVRGWTGTATDVSPRALAVAAENAARHGVADRVRFVQSDVFPSPPVGADLLVSNPPYVTTAEMEALPPEVRHEPREALDGGADGLDVIRRIVRGARATAPRLLLEIGAGQAAAVRALVLQSGFSNVVIHKDLDG